MKREELAIGAVYGGKVSGKIQPLKLISIPEPGDREKPYLCRNVNTNREIRFRSAKRLRYLMVATERDGFTTYAQPPQTARRRRRSGRNGAGAGVGAPAPSEPGGATVAEPRLTPAELEEIYRNMDEDDLAAGLVSRAEVLAAHQAGAAEPRFPVREWVTTMDPRTREHAEPRVSMSSRVNLPAELLRDNQTPTIGEALGQLWGDALIREQDRVLAIGNGGPSAQVQQAIARVGDMIVPDDPAAATGRFTVPETLNAEELARLSRSLADRYGTGRCLTPEQVDAQINGRWPPFEIQQEPPPPTDRQEQLRSFMRAALFDHQFVPVMPRGGFINNSV